MCCLLWSCLDPSQPEFRTGQPFYLVEGGVVAGGTTAVRLRVSDFDDALLDLLPVNDAEVVLEDGRGQVQGFELTEGRVGEYRPAADFSPEVGEQYAVRVTFADGTVARSLPETLAPPVAVTGLDVRLNETAFFDEGRNRFVPAHELFVDYTDPADQINFYAYDFRFWEAARACATCVQGLFREGACTPPQQNFFTPTFDYLCDTPECYRIQPGRQTRFGTDELTNGRAVNGFGLGRIEFDEYGGLLIEAQLRSITPAAHDYGRVLQDLTMGNAGLNATTPAALIGNVSSENTTGREVLGFFGVANQTTIRRYLERRPEDGILSQPERQLNLEPDGPISPAPRAPCDIPGRTSVRPAGWGG